MTPEWRYHPQPLVFRKGDRVRTYRPENKWQEKAIRGVMRRHGWRLLATSLGGGEGVALVREGASKGPRQGMRGGREALEAPSKGLRVEARPAPRGDGHDA